MLAASAQGARAVALRAEAPRAGSEECAIAAAAADGEGCDSKQSLLEGKAERASPPQSPAAAKQQQQHHHHATQYERDARALLAQWGIAGDAAATAAAATPEPLRRVASRRQLGRGSSARVAVAGLRGALPSDAAALLDEMASLCWLGGACVQAALAEPALLASLEQLLASEDAPPQLCISALLFIAEM
jgi:hypothetical protein